MGTESYLRVKFCLCSDVDLKGMLNHEKKMWWVCGRIVDKVFFLQIISYCFATIKSRYTFLVMWFLLEPRLVEVTQYILVSSSFFFHGYRCYVARSLELCLFWNCSRMKGLYEAFYIKTAPVMAPPLVPSH